MTEQIKTVVEEYPDSETKRVALFLIGSLERGGMPKDVHIAVRDKVEDLVLKLDKESPLTEVDYL